MKILVVGGGSGGHITPAVAVVRELLEKQPRARVEFWTDRKYYKNVVKITTELGVRWGSDAGTIRGKVPYIRVRKVCAGKFRRYAGWTWRDWIRNWWIVLKDLVFGNIVGFFGFVGGIIQGFWRLLLPSRRPDVIFLKGGFVGLPVGLVAQKLKIPYVVHESDAVPGLANRILMKHATVVATGWKSLKMEGACIVQTGIPVAPEFKAVTPAQQKNLKKDFGFDQNKPLVVVTGGSQGSENINEAMKEILPEMLKFANVGLVAGRKHYENMVELKRYEEWDKAKLKSNFRMWEFNSAMSDLLGAADVVVSRAGATTIAELAALEKAVILVPFERLPGGHQLRNAKDLYAMDAVLMVEDERMRQQPVILLNEVRHLVRAPRERALLAEKLRAAATPDAAARLATILVEVANGSTKIEEMTTGQKNDPDNGVNEAEITEKKFGDKAEDKKESEKTDQRSENPAKPLISDIEKVESVEQEVMRKEAKKGQGFQEENSSKTRKLRVYKAEKKRMEKMKRKIKKRSTEDWK